MRATGRDEVGFDPSAGFRQPCLNQFGVMVPGVVDAHAAAHRLNGHQRHDRAHRVHDRHVPHDSLAGLQVDRTMDVNRSRPLLCSPATGVSSGHALTASTPPPKATDPPSGGYRRGLFRKQIRDIMAAPGFPTLQVSEIQAAVPRPGRYPYREKYVVARTFEAGRAGPFGGCKY